MFQNSNQTAFNLLNAKRQSIAQDLHMIEEKIYDLETDYFTSDNTSYGTVFKGFEGFLTSKNAAAKNKLRVFRLEDRLFSLSSYTSKGTQELNQQHEAQQAAADAGIRGAKGVYAKAPAGNRRGY